MTTLAQRFQITKDFTRFYVLPTGPNVILQIGSYICMFFFLSSLRNVAQQLSAYNNCSMDQNFYDHLSIWLSCFIAVFSLLGLVTTLHQLIRLFNNRTA